MCADFIEVNAGKQPEPLLFGELYRVLTRLRPAEKVVLQPLVPEAKSGVIPPEGFDFIAGAVAEDIQRPVEGRVSPLLLNNQCEAVDAFAKIHIPRVEPDSGRTDKHLHRVTSRSRMASQSGEVSTGSDNVAPGRTRASCGAVRDNPGTFFREMVSEGVGVQTSGSGGNAGMNE